MGTERKKIPIEKITNEKSRLVKFSKRKRGLFRKNKQVEFLADSRIASVLFSPTGRLHTYGEVNYAIQRHFSSAKLSTLGVNSDQSNSDVVIVSGGESGSRSLSTPRRNSLRKWVEGIDVEGCKNLNQLLLLKEQPEGTREKMGSIEDAQLFEAMFA